MKKETMGGILWVVFFGTLIAMTIWLFASQVSCFNKRTIDNTKYEKLFFRCLESSNAESSILSSTINECKIFAHDLSIVINKCEQ